MTELSQESQQLGLRSLLECLEDETNTASTSPTITPPKSSLTVLDILSLYPVCDRLCSHLDIAGILLLKKISKTLSGNIEAHLKKRWDINRRLNRFVRDPRGLRSLLGKHDALISGSFVIQFLEGVTWEESDLDIFVMTGPSAVVLGQYLYESEGYRIEKEDVAPIVQYPKSILNVITYKRKANNIETKVQLVISSSTPIQGILWDFYNTAVVNVITWNTVYSMFPRSTFIDRTAYMLKGPDEKIEFEKLVEKYTDRGWQFLPHMTTGDSKINIDVCRYVSDSKTWKLNLNVEGVDVPNTPDFVIENTYFQLTKQHILLPADQYYCVTASTVRLSIFKYTYNESVRGDHAFWSFVKDRVRALARIELEKMSEAERPAYLNRALTRPRRDLAMLHHDLQRPPTWTYHDEKIPGWKKEWEASMAASAVLAAAGNISEAL